ncbi:MAG: hypothetical protein C0436_00155 [Alphaproteobacteria bacterium]|nr:hypothetical protein [Alphaproteobacteria bacterium]
MELRKVSFTWRGLEVRASLRLTRGCFPEHGESLTLEVVEMEVDMPDGSDALDYLTLAAVSEIERAAITEAVE